MTDGIANTANAESSSSLAPCRTGAYRMTVSTRLFPWLVFIGAVLVGAALLLGFSAPAHAQTLVSNTGQTTHGHTACVLGSEPTELDCAQGFTTGQNSRGYDLSSIQLDTQGAPGSGTLTVTVRAATGSGRPSNAVLHTLTNPSNIGTGLQTFTALGGARLNRNTQYFVHMTFDGSGTRPRWNLTANDNEDSGKARGWSIGNHRYTRRSDGTGGWEGDGGVYSTSIQIRVKGNTLAPAAPENLSATPGETEVTLTWADPGNNTITKYQYRRKTGAGAYGNWTDIGGSGASTDSYTVTGLTNGTEYTFAVRAKNVGGNGAAATVRTETLPAAPTNLWPAPGDGEVTLSWTDPDSDTITSYQVSTDGGGNFTVIDSNDIIENDTDNTLEHTVTGLTNGTQYTLALRARNASGPGRASTATATPRAPPAAPTGLSATAGDGQVTLSWTNPGDNTIRKYQYSTDGGGTFHHMNRSSWATTTHTVTGLSNGTQYTLALRAVNAFGDGPASTATAMPLWAAPANLSATPGDRQVTLTWTDPGDSTITKYQVSTDGGVTFIDIGGSNSATTANTVTHLSGAPATRLSNGTTYTLALRAANASAHGAASSATTRPLWPAPTNLAADPGDGEAILQWDTGDALITDYRVHWQATSSGATPEISPEISDVTAGSGLTTTATIEDLTNGTEYTFTVQAVDKSGSPAVITGLPSSTTATPAPVPDGPANLSATARSQEVGLTWDGSADSTITKYQVSTDSGTNFADIEGSSAATTATTVTGLTNGTAYTLAVRAVNDSGEGAAPRVTATPLWPAPTGLVAVPNNGQVKLQWDRGVPGITKYHVLTEGPGTDINTLVPAGSGTKTTVTDTGLTNGAEYTFTVRAALGTDPANATFTSVASTVTATPELALPAAPTGLTPTAGDGQVTLSWDDPNDLTLTGYDYSTDGGATFTAITGLTEAPTSYSITGLTNDTEYTLALRAENASGKGPWSDNVTATPIAKPGAPVNFKATRGSNGGEVALTWDDPDNDTITGYEYRRKRGNRAFGGWVDIGGSDKDTTAHTVTGLSNGREYTFELWAMNASGEGAADSDKATPLWPAPNLVATPDHGRVHLEWTGVPGAKDYILDSVGPDLNLRSFIGLSEPAEKVDDSIGLDPNNPLTNGTEYTFTVWSTTAGGTQTSVKAIETATPVAPPLPAAPTISSATPGDQQVALSWDDPDNITITKYQVRWKVTDSDDSTYTPGVDITHPNPYATPPTPPTTYTATGLTNGTTYTFEVRAGNGTGEGPASTVDAKPIAIPNAPENLSAAPGDGQVALSWDKPSNDATIGNYTYEVSTDGGTTFAEIEGSSATTTAHTVMGLTNGTEYTFAVRAVNGTGNGLVATVNARPIAVPAAPTISSVTPGDGQVALEWADPDDSSITMYQVRWKVKDSDDSTYTAWANIAVTDPDAPPTGYIVTGLTDDPEYTFALRAENASGVGPASTVDATMQPAAPTNLTPALGSGGGEVALSWDDPDNDTITGYQVSTDGGTIFTDIPNSAHGQTNATEYTVTGLTNGTEYTFALRAVNASGNSTASPDVTATPLWPAPKNMAAAPGDGQVMLTWDTGDPGIARYKVSTTYTSTGGTYLNTVLSPGSGDQTTLVIPGLTNRTDYTFTVQAVDTSGDDTVITGRAGSVDATPVPVPAAPANLAAMPANGQAVLTWDDPNDSSITKYQYRTDAGATFADIGDSNATTTTYTVTGLTNGATYTIELRAVNGTGDGAASSVDAMPIAIPNAPENLRATPGDGQVALAWAAPSDDTIPITGYQVSTDGGATFTEINGSNATTTTYTVDRLTDGTNAGLTNGTQYTLAVRAKNDQGSGLASTVTARPTAPPAAPAISRVGPAYREVALAWADPNDSTITGYQISTNGGGKFAEISGSNAKTTTHTATGLTNGTEYTFAVRAMNVAGSGDASTANATPFNTPPTGSDKEVSTNENEPYAFTMKFFDIMDADGGTLNHVKITSLPGAGGDTDKGTLSLDGRDITSVTPPQQVTKAELKQGKLIYTPPENAHGEPFTTFLFKVNDGESDSVTYIITINVVRVYSVRFGAAAYEADEGGDPVEVKVMLSPPAAVALDIPIRVTPKGWTVADDYTVAGLDDWHAATGTGTLTFGVDESTKSFTITAKEEAEENEDFLDGTVILSFGAPPEDVTKGAPATATLTIIDAEGAAVRARFRRLNEEILSKHALTLADVINRAISARMDDPCGKQAAAYTLAGGSTIAGALRSNARAFEDGTLTLDDVLAGSSFRLPLAAVNDDMAGGPGGPVVWGRGDRHRLESKNSAFAWDGTVLTGQLGIDGCPRDDLVTGLTLSRSIGEFAYTDGTGPAPVSGDYESRMTSVHPYLGWFSTQGLGLWATVGYGRGEIAIDDEQVRRGDTDNPVRHSDTTLKTAALGARGPVMSDGSLIAGGTTTLMLKGEASVAQVEVEGNDYLIEKQTVNANRLRLALEGSHEQALASGSSLTPSLELGLRQDGGDGVTGGGLEIGGSLRYRDPATGLTVEGGGRVLTGQVDYREWGLGGSLRLDPGADGRGLSFSLVPTWGETSSGVERLWDQDIAELATDDTPANDNVPQMRLDSELGYGFGALGGHGLLTPYGGFSLAGEGSQRYRIGSRFEIGTAFNLSLEGDRREPANDAAAEHSVMLRMQARW